MMLRAATIFVASTLDDLGFMIDFGISEIRPSHDHFLEFALVFPMGPFSLYHVRYDQVVWVTFLASV